MFERFGLESVPQHMKQTTWLEYFIIQLAFSVNSGNFLVPALAVLEGGLSFFGAVSATILGAGSAFFFVSLLSLPGVKYGLPAQYVIRTMLGTRFTRFIASPVRAVTSLYWFSVQTIGGTFVLQSLYHLMTGNTLPFVPLALLLAFIMTVLALVGFDAVKKATKWFMPILIIGQFLMLFLFIQKGIQQPLSIFPKEQALSIPAFFFFASLAFVQYVSGVSASADVARYAKSEQHAFWGLFSGNMIGFTMTAVLASFSATLFESSNPFIASSEITSSSFFLLLISLCSVVSMISINLSNAYTGGFSLLNAIPSLGRVKASLLFGVTGITISCFPVLVDEAKIFISLLGALVIPISAVIIINYLFVKKQQISATDLNVLQNGSYHWNISALVTVIFAFLLYLVLPEGWSPGFFAFFVACGLYFILASSKQKTSSL